MSKVLTRAQFDQRNRELEEAERLAAEAHSQAAFAEEIGEGSEEQTRKAKKIVEAAREKRETLRLAFNRSQSDNVERRKERAEAAHKEFVEAVEADLKRRAELVAEIIELSDKLGARIFEHTDLRDKMRRTAHNFVRDYRSDLPALGATDGLKRPGFSGGSYL